MVCVHESTGTWDALLHVTQGWALHESYAHPPYPFVQSREPDSYFLKSTSQTLTYYLFTYLLQEFRAFELLRSSRDRINYLLTREAKIIAMTCTHAALKRKDLVQLSFKVTESAINRLQYYTLLLYASLWEHLET